MNNKIAKSALISVYYKEGLDKVVKKFQELGIEIYSTGGTKSYIENLGINVTAVEDVTNYPSIFDGRVKTLHPNVFGGILYRRELESHQQEKEKYNIPSFDIVIVDLYPFEETVMSGAPEQDIIEKIDIGGISLIRAAAKNFKDVLIVSSRNQYSIVLELLEKNNGEFSLDERKIFAKQAFNISSHYDTQIYKYFGEQESVFKESIFNSTELRYGENPHQKGFFFGDFNAVFDKLNGKEISYNNLLDIDAAVNLINEFDETTFAILKHNNACGIASRENLLDAWKDALACDPVSAFGGILITNREIDKATAEEINKLFFEVVIAPSFAEDALNVLSQNKKRIILVQKQQEFAGRSFRSILNGALVQDRDLKMTSKDELKTVTNFAPANEMYEDLIFANKIVKHTKSNAIVLVKGKQLMASGVGQTSRVDALKQAIEKAKHFEFDLNNSVMASDAFFPFSDSVEIAHKEGIKAVIQPGGSIRDKDSINFCNEHSMAMVFSGTRHFKH
jgi:phosphoribosylaminoimidazolecarboxamide formyltransferase / IMP cyclohydrolase